MKDFHCPKCGHSKLWIIRRNRQRCANCRYEWLPGKLPLQLTQAEWKKIIRFFLMELSGQRIAEETKLERRRVIRALMWIRKYLLKEIPKELQQEVRFQFPQMPQSETTAPIPAKPMLGILFRGGKVWAELIPPEGLSHLLPLDKKKSPPGSVISFDIWKHYAGVVIRGSLHRLSGIEGENSNLISELESFWGFLKRKLSGKGGIRRARLPLYLAEYNWRYNHRHELFNNNLNSILAMLGTRAL